ncbi:caspase-8 isoform X1 [Esox lucius]|uniref:caspase-8 isoform X1 n=1 Tax=Esox lucius TaxID=8010 RepID=UPI001476E5A7|nr:caspase-8 isoform X1 [Esox lucius]XP_010862890.2 caspase-8 isoform X1 [Esox lucius]XP_028976559.2 caspase-8 isoform X1 [Esox lucius]
MDSVHLLLLNTLEDLANDDLKRFQWFLKQDMVHGFPPIPRSRLEKADRLDTVDVMVTTYDRDGAVKITLEILKRISQNYLAEQLENEIFQKHRSDPEAEAAIEDNPGKLDDKQDIEIEVLQLLKRCQPEDALRIIKKVKRDLNLDEVRKYGVTSKPRGLCLILNNVEFKDIKHIDDRNGSNIDAGISTTMKALARLFSWLGFCVVMCKDKKKKEMEEVLNIFSKLNQFPELQQCGVMEWAGERRKFIDLDGRIQHGDVFICCVLSHGVDRGIYGTDGQVLPTNDLLLPFTPSNCPDLKEKPKLFFIQACRIDPEQNNMRQEEAQQLRQLEIENKKAIAEMKARNKSLQPDSVGPRISSKEVQEASREPLYSIDNDADFLMAMATVDKRKAYRDPEKGSLFIQSLCLQLTQGCPRGDDILGILTRVNNEVSNNKEKTPQMPEVKSRLRSLLVIPLPV